MRGNISGDLAAKLMDHLDDDSIMRLIKKTDYATNAIKKAVKVLKSKENIFFLLEQNSMRDLYLGVSAMEAMDSNPDIIRIMEIFDFCSDIYRNGIPLMDLENKSAFQLLEYMERSGYSEHFCLLLVANSNLSPQELVENLFYLAPRKKKAIVAKAILPHLLDKKFTIRVLGGVGYDDDVALKANWEVLKTEKEVIVLFQECRKKGITATTLWEKKVRPLLSLSSWSDGELFDFMNSTKTGFRRKPDPVICRDCMRHLSTQDKRWDVVEYLNYHPAVLEEALSLSSPSWLDTKLDIAEAIMESGLNIRVGQILIAWAQNEKQALYILEKTKYNIGVFTSGLHLLSPPNIWFALQKLNFEPVLLKDALPYMDLENKSEGEIKELIQEVNNDVAKEKLAAYLDLKNKTLEEILDIAKENDFPPSLCRVAAEKAELQEA